LETTFLASTERVRAWIPGWMRLLISGREGSRDRRRYKLVTDHKDVFGYILAYLREVIFLG
jgi:hypothetical protein